MEELLNCCPAAPCVAQAWARCMPPLLCMSSSSPRGITIATYLYKKYIVERYQEPQRFYHTMLHIEAMFAELEAYTTARNEAASTNSQQRPQADRWAVLVMDLAVLFHDAVYDPTVSENEDQSAVWLKQFLTETQAAAQQQVGTHQSEQGDMLWEDAEASAWVETEAQRFILATKHHLSAEPVCDMQLHSSASDPALVGVSFELDSDLCVFLDLDLSVLGSEPAKYVTYSANIAKEYSHFPPEAFAKGRGAFLEKFLYAKQWFKTPFFFNRYEAKARENVRREAASLKTEA